MRLEWNCVPSIPVKIMLYVSLKTIIVYATVCLIIMERDANIDMTNVRKDQGNSKVSYISHIKHNRKLH